MTECGGRSSRADDREGDAAAAMTQKGTTSFMKCDRPLLPQAHLRFSQ